MQSQSDTWHIRRRHKDIVRSAKYTTISKHIELDIDPKGQSWLADVFDRYEVSRLCLPFSYSHHIGAPRLLLSRLLSIGRRTITIWLIIRWSICSSSSWSRSAVNTRSSAYSIRLVTCWMSVLLVPLVIDLRIICSSERRSRKWPGNTETASQTMYRLFRARIVSHICQDGNSVRRMLIN